MMILDMWYAAYLIYFDTIPDDTGLATVRVRQDLVLLESGEPETAFEKANQIGKTRLYTNGDFNLHFQGLTDLMPLTTGIHDGAVIDASSDAIATKLIDLFLAAKTDLTARSQEEAMQLDGGSHWYLAQLVFSSCPQWELAVERQKVLKELVLIKADESDGAFYRAVVFGKDRSMRLPPAEPGGQWHFRGLNDLTIVEDPIADGMVLLSERFQVPRGDQLTLVRSKEEMKALAIQ